MFLNYHGIISISTDNTKPQLIVEFCSFCGLYGLLQSKLID